MTRVLNETEKKHFKKYTNMRRVCIAVFVIGIIIFVAIHFVLGDGGAKTIGQVYGILLGGLMVFAGGSGIGISSLFLKLLLKEKDTAW